MDRKGKMFQISMSGNSDLPYIVLVSELIIVFLLLSFSSKAHFFLEQYASMPVMVFISWCVSQRMNSSQKRIFSFSKTMVLWCLFLCIYHFFVDGSNRSIGGILSTYMLALPFAQLTLDGIRRTGLKLAGIFYIASALVISVLSILLITNAMPPSLTEEVFFDGTRIYTLHHPNSCGALFLIAIGFCLYFLSNCSSVWLKAVFGSMLALFFACQSLTHSRTAILATCAMIAGFVFFHFYGHGWKRAVIGMMIAVPLIPGLFIGSSMLFNYHSALVAGASPVEEAIDTEDHSLIYDSGMENTALETENEIILLENQIPLSVSVLEDPAEPEQYYEDEAVQESELAENRTISAQGSFFADLLTLNSRLRIWASAVYGIVRNPLTLLFGAKSVPEIISSTGIFENLHAHNSWLEVLLWLGIPGLVGAILLTVLAICSVFSVLFSQSRDIGQKCIAMMVAGCLILGFMESGIFLAYVGYYHVDFLLFLGLGYLLSWQSDNAVKEQA